ncbi:hypothetical protein CDAR_562921 [Caerostris darwini]|uniref:Uncharacterized protein n=1 Tax=Caerostris darwini TaxID=1538125 RepID=A0AAV4X5R8_9ARAC|nr:hypothetical protein CDAR_562921 [Caerostris darwini]
MRSTKEKHFHLRRLFNLPSLITAAPPETFTGVLHDTCSFALFISANARWNSLFLFFSSSSVFRPPSVERVLFAEDDPPSAVDVVLNGTKNCRTSVKGGLFRVFVKGNR